MFFPSNIVLCCTCCFLANTSATKGINFLKIRNGKGRWNINRNINEFSISQITKCTRFFRHALQSPTRHRIQRQNRQFNSENVVVNRSRHEGTAKICIQFSVRLVQTNNACNVLALKQLVSDSRPLYLFRISSINVLQVVSGRREHG